MDQMHKVLIIEGVRDLEAVPFPTFCGECSCRPRFNYGKSGFDGKQVADALSQGGMKAVALAAMDPTPARYYHTRGDTADNLDPKTIEAGINILLETAFLYDSEGLKDEY